MSNQGAAPPPVGRGKSGSGVNTCLLAAGIGCATVVLLAFVIVIAGFFLARSAVRTVVAEYTDSEPIDLPTVTISDEERESLQERFDAFQEDLAEGIATEPLTLTETEANALIRYHPDFDEIQDNVYVTFKDGFVQGQISLPLEMFSHLPLVGGLVEGRYLNGTGTFNIDVSAGRLVVRPVEIEVRGEPLPDQLMNELRGQNLLADIDHDPELVQKIGQLESIEVGDGVITFVPRTDGTTQ